MEATTLPVPADSTERVGRSASVIPLILPSAIAIPVRYLPAVTAVSESRASIAARVTAESSSISSSV